MSRPDLSDDHPIREFVIRTGNIKDGFQRACVHIATLEAKLSKMERLREACAEADQLLDAMATDGIKGWLVPAVRPLYAEVHTQLRAALTEKA